MTEPVLICTDLDRTLIPNGPAPESPSARCRFAAVAGRPEVSLAYVTGRDLPLVEAAMREFSLPVPRFLIGDVGTTIYSAEQGEWMACHSWSARLQRLWPEGFVDGVRDQFAVVGEIQLQEASKQGALKLSYYSDPGVDSAPLLEELERRLALQGAPARLIFSRDEAGTGLLDVIPSAAGKLAAIEFLMQARHFPGERVLFAGDSGNDIEVLTSRLPAVLVANATESVRRTAREEAFRAGRSERLHLARGGLLGMNGNYSAGILEGLAHFLPETLEWM